MNQRYLHRRPVGRFAFRCRDCWAQVEPMEEGLWIDEFGRVACPTGLLHDGHPASVLDHLEKR